MADKPTVVNNLYCYLKVEGVTASVYKMPDSPTTVKIRITNSNPLQFPEIIEFYLSKEQADALADCLKKGITL